MLQRKGLDLNLLITLDALIKDPNLTRVAKQLHLSQPSVSLHLAKLRQALDDPLFHPGPRGMIPTSRALSLQQPLKEALALIERSVLIPEVFTPKSSQRTWNIIASDYAESSVLAPALPALRQLAPHSRLAVIESSNKQSVHNNIDADIDLMFHVFDEAPNGLRCRKLFTERYVLAFRRGHPIIDGKPSLEQFLQCEFVIISNQGGGFWGQTDDALSKLSEQRTVALSVPHFIFAVNALLKSDLVAMLPYRLVYDNPQLQYVEAPIEIPSFDMYMLWNERLHKDPAHRWLRELIVDSLPSL